MTEPIAQDGTDEGKVFFFGADNIQTQDATLDVVGGKAFNLMRMARIEMPIPPGFVLSTQFCANFLRQGKRLPKGLPELLESNIRRLENMVGFTFGGSRRPLLVSVRSGAAVSMPGMMDTILDIGLTDTTVKALVRMTGNPRMAWDSYRRLVETYAKVVHRCPTDGFDSLLGRYLEEEDLPNPRELDAESLENLTLEYLDAYAEQVGSRFPQRPIDQLVGAVEAVFRSWESKRAAEFRRINNISGLLGTAVTVQTMVFGNMGATSGSGVAFTRDPATGDNDLYMDFLFNAQGEDVVSGRNAAEDAEEFKRVLPGVYREIHRVRKVLEEEFKDVQDFEFTVQEGKLYMLQCRTGKRTPWAALKIAVDMVQEGLIDPQIALKRLALYDLERIERVRLSSKTAEAEPLCKGIPASPGVAIGQVALDTDTAKFMVSKGRPVILVREDTSTADIAGMAICNGILTVVGGRTSHAAVVARQLNKVCIVGCGTMGIDLRKRWVNIAARTYSEGDFISLDGNTGNVYAGALDVIVEKPKKYLAEVDRWKDEGRGKQLSITAFGS
jgi:pyruvate,orthophosphate dikinase